MAFDLSTAVPYNAAPAKGGFDLSTATKYVAPVKQVKPDKDGLSDVQRSLMAGDSDNLSEGAPGLVDVAKAMPQGVNSSVVDLAGLPMDTANNAANLVKAGIGYPLSKMTGQAPPSALEATDAKDVPLTSEWLKNKVRDAGGSNLIDPADNAASRGVHAVSEMVGAAPLAEGLRAPEAPVIGTAGTTGVKPGTGTPLESLRSAGYKVRPTDITAANPAEPAGALATVAEAVGGGKQLQKETILHNQQNSTSLAGQVIDKPDATKLNPEDFAKAKVAPGKVYDATGDKLGTFAPSPEMEMDLEGLAGSQGMDPGAGMEANRLLKRVQAGEDLVGPDFMKDIQRIRALKGGDVVSNVLENEVARQLQERDPNALSDYQGARTKFAQIYTVQKNTRRGQINAAKIGEIHAKNDQLLTGPLRLIGIAANEAPGVMKLPSTAPGSTMDKISSALHVLTTPVRKVLASDSVQNNMTGAQVADPVTASYGVDAGKRPDALTQRPPTPLLQIGHEPGEAPIPAGADVDAGASRAPVNNPAELNSVLNQTAGAVQANPPAAPTPLVKPTIQGQLALPAPGQLAPRGVQDAAIKVTPEGNARLSDPVRDFISDTGTQGNPAEARRAAMSTILAKSIRDEPALPANWLRVERDKPGNSHLSIEDARRKYIVEALRNSP